MTENKILSLKTELTEANRKSINLEKRIRDLTILVDSQERLIKKLEKQYEENTLLLDACLNKIKEKQNG